MLRYVPKGTKVSQPAAYTGACWINHFRGLLVFKTNSFYMINWLKKNTWQILFFITVIVILYQFFQGLQKDHTLDLFKLEIKLKEDARISIQAEREARMNIVTLYSDSIKNMKNRDEIYEARVSALTNQIDNLSKRYNEKATVINTYGSDDLQQYFNNLPVQPDNDY